jgi:uncharacterized membrane-anchored protein YjiN (DUF445 family)
MGNQQLHDQDFYSWAIEQARLLRADRLSEADIEHIAEEIESLGKSEKRELVSRLLALLAHLLKWQYQPERRGKSWRNTIATQRLDVADHLADNPSLRAKLEQAIADASKRARLAAANETDFDADAFPAACPWTFDQIMDPDFRPEAWLDSLAAVPPGQS